MEELQTLELSNPQLNRDSLLPSGRDGRIPKLSKQWLLNEHFSSTSMSNKLQSKSEDLLYHNQCRNENKISKVSTFMSQFVSF